MKLKDVVVLREEDRSTIVGMRLADNKYPIMLTKERKELFGEEEVIGLKINNGVVIVKLALLTDEYRRLTRAKELTDKWVAVFDNAVIRCILENDDYYG